jgi:alpha-glucosidase
MPGHHAGRDPERTPMQWDASSNAGFTSGTPWLPVSHDYTTLNVEHQRNDPHSMLTMQRRLIALRRNEASLTNGPYAPVLSDGDLIAYTRGTDDRTFLIVLNLGGNPQELSLARLGRRGTIVLNTQLDREGESVSGSIALRGDEGVVVRLD